MLRIYVEAVGLATSPDGAVIRGPLQQHAPSPEATAVNPAVLLEVTSSAISGGRIPVETLAAELVVDTIFRNSSIV